MLSILQVVRAVHRVQEGTPFCFDTIQTIAWSADYLKENITPDFIFWLNAPILLVYIIKLKHFKNIFSHWLLVFSWQ